MKTIPKNNCIAVLTTLCGAIITLVVFLKVVNPAIPGYAKPSITFQQNASVMRYVAITGHDSLSCTNSISPCRTIQYAIDVADNGDIIKIAQGVYLVD